MKPSKGMQSLVYPDSPMLLRSLQDRGGMIRFLAFRDIGRLSASHRDPDPKPASAELVRRGGLRGRFPDTVLRQLSRNRFLFMQWSRPPCAPSCSCQLLSRWRRNGQSRQAPSPLVRRQAIGSYKACTFM
jgi:hypothetical protein